jgi:septum formation protein
MNWMHNRKLILASQSPRRKELLRAAGFEFDIRIANIDEENIPPGIPVENVPAFLAESKAQKINLETDEDLLILAADSLVFKNNIIYSKPTNRQDAIQIISSLSNAEHTVITGVCLMDKKTNVLQSVYTQVSFKEISKEEIEYYVDKYKPYDKAGAYGIQDWIGICKVDKIFGSYTNIMGLPMETVYELLFHKLNSTQTK